MMVLSIYDCLPIARTARVCPASFLYNYAIQEAINFVLLQCSSITQTSMISARHGRLSVSCRSALCCLLEVRLLLPEAYVIWINTTNFDSFDSVLPL